jgi:hypothetical protein
MKLVNDRALLLDLSEVATVEIDLSVGRGVGQANVGSRRR